MAKRKRFMPIENNECPLCGSLIVYESVPFSNGDEHIKAICTNCTFDKFIPDYKENKDTRTDGRLMKWANAVKKRDNYVCKLCGTSENIEAHHIISIKTCKQLKYADEIYFAFHPNNGITLCKTCHELAHGKVV